ncbi:peptidase s41 family protein [Biscogniauxia sp. FL1348]|nr:peptidase s41 family protein [Biscogniauxia sp. FL1348]
MKTLAGAGAVALAAVVVDLTTAATIPETTTTTGTPTEPCAIVSSAWAAQISATSTPTVEASVAYACLNSVPIDKDGALKYVTEMEPYIEWQSDTVFKKNPPADYYYPPHDIWAAINAVKADIAADKYANEYEWQADLYQKVFGPAHDGHFVVYPDALTSALEWQRPFALVSVSEEGPDGSAPVIKVYEDVVSSPETASVVKLINGQDAATFVLDWINQASGNQDADAAYNSMFYEKAYVAENGNPGNFKWGGRTRYIYPGETTSFTFENGTELELPNLARIKGGWNGVVDGPSFFSAFCPNAQGTPTNAAPTTTTSASTTSSATATPTAVEGYPAPVMISSDSAISGYFLEGEGFEDVAVIAMLSFAPEDQVEFQRVAQDFFAASVAAGKTKLVVDVQANGGGYIFSGYDLFRQLFPDIVQEGLGRWRESDGFLAVADVFSAASAGFDADTASYDVVSMYESVYNWRYDLNETNGHFASYADKFAPHEHLGDAFTNLMQWDFDDPLSTSNDTFGFATDITGYRSRRNFTRPFAGPADIVLLLDGYCASTCTLFSQFLRDDAGVQSIAMGGRPSHRGLIQGVGGVKGSQSYGYADVRAVAQLAAGYTNDSATAATLAQYTTYVDDRSNAASLNVKDEIYRAHVADGVPAQFVADYSDCRLWWTEPMIADVSELWKAAATAAFKGGKCAYGSIGGASNATSLLSATAAASKSKSSALSGLKQSAHPKASYTTQQKKMLAENPIIKANRFMKVID